MLPLALQSPTPVDVACWLGIDSERFLTFANLARCWRPEKNRRADRAEAQPQRRSAGCPEPLPQRTTTTTTMLVLRRAPVLFVLLRVGNSGAGGHAADSGRSRRLFSPSVRSAGQ